MKPGPEGWHRGVLAVLAVFGLCGLTAAAPEPAPSAIDFSPAELQRIRSHGPWPMDTVALDAGNAQAGRREAIALGQQLFFEPRLAPDSRLSCASCHLPSLAFTDGQPRATGRLPLPRHTPSLWNAVHERWYGWDGAADSLWSQAIRPILDAREMASSAAQVAAVIAADVELGCRYRQVFGAGAGAAPEATLVNAAKAIAAFVGTLVSGRTAFDDFRDALARGDRRAAAAYPAAAQRGLRLFIGRGQCAACHVGPRFSNGEFADIGRPFFVAPGVVDNGRHGGIAALRASRYNLLSSWSDDPRGAAAVKTRHVEAQHRNFGEFKVPGLRNVALTAPYMHDGRLATLDAVLQHYAELDLDRLHADGEQILKPLRLDDGERAELLAFLRSLSDARARDWQAPPLAPCPGDRPRLE